MKTCVHCGGTCTAEAGRWHYVECGLDNVWLNGVEVRTCGSCDRRSVVIPGILKLHEDIARVLVRQPEKLRGAELAFLRQYLGLSKADLAASMAVGESDVAAWEATGVATPMQERFLRVLVTHGRPATEYPVNGLVELGVDELAGLGLRPAVVTRQIDLERRRGKTWRDRGGSGAVAA